MKVKVRSFRIRHVIFGSIFLIFTFHMTLVSAHTSLISSVPANASTIAHWPTEISLTFGEELQVISGKKINYAAVTNALAEELSTGQVTVKGKTLTVPILPNPATGLVLVNYRVAASDGHIVEGEFTFTYQKSSEVTPSSSPTPHSHGGSNNLPIYASTTVLIVLALLFGMWSYRRK